MNFIKTSKSKQPEIQVFCSYEKNNSSNMKDFIRKSGFVAKVTFNKYWNELTLNDQPINQNGSKFGICLSGFNYAGHY